MTTSTIISLALAYKDQQQLDREWKAAKSTFNLQYGGLERKRKEGNERVETLRSQLYGEAILRWDEGTLNDELPYSIRVTYVPTIHNRQALIQYAIDNMPELLDINEEKVKNYVQNEGRIIADGEVLAGIVPTPILVAGEKTLIGWLDQQAYEEAHGTKDEGE